MQNVFTKTILLFSCFLMLQEQPDGARQQNGSVGAAAASYQHGKGEIMNRLAAEQEDRHDGKQGSDRRVNGTGQCRLDTVVDHIRYRFSAAMHFQVFTDAVKNYDGAVDQIPYYCQQRGYESGVNFQLQQGEPTQRNRHVND